MFIRENYLKDLLGYSNSENLLTCAITSCYPDSVGHMTEGSISGSLRRVLSAIRDCREIPFTDLLPPHGVVQALLFEQ